ncbi:PREDICTED: mitochondrial peptide methionine sulfoxide reductase, partial [Pterocles gutturalis]|uniref:mitochondrial peptide methionine sulfoxide reductase n=1 Tax=Pterocles gutturalis TaxID=240206 RepID=UPI0005289C83
KTGHAEVVRVVYQPENISFEKLLKVFWENHDPTQGMRQGNDFGTQYRSAIYTFSQEQMEAALRSKEEYQKSEDIPVRAVLPAEKWRYSDEYAWSRASLAADGTECVQSESAS